MPKLCRYGDLLQAGALLACADVDPVICPEFALYKAIVATDNDGFEISMTVPLCLVHEAHVSQNTGYKRSIKLREPLTT